MIERVEVEDQVFFTADHQADGAVRAVGRDRFLLYVENGGEFWIAASAITAVHDHKVMLDPARVPRDVRDAVSHRHDREDPNVAG